MALPISDKNQALGKAQKYCYSQDRCISEVTKKLNDWLVDPSLHEGIIDELIDERFIDEERYVRSFVNGKLNYNKWGKIKIKYALIQKGIPGKLIASEFENINEEKYQETLNTLISKKFQSLREDDIYQLRAKLFRYGASKGFESNYINIAIDNLNLEEK
jgi:regulatory protein